MAVAVGAGHAFKFASVIGKILGELVTGGTDFPGLAPFCIDRPILQEENPPVNFLV